MNEKYPNLLSPAVMRGRTLKNRIVAPPILTFGYGSPDGTITQKHLEHYAGIADGGAGLIIVEAICVTKFARNYKTQMGIWDDMHIAGLTELSKVCRRGGAPALLQIHHAGLVTVPEACDVAYGPSVYDDMPHTREMTREQICETISQFTAAAVRAQKAGFDGVELHACHGYLLSQFASAADNRRTDEYGGSAAGRTLLARTIYSCIREACGNDFIVGIRFGADCPSVDDGLEIAAQYDACGFDYLSVSHSTRSGQKAEIPDGWFMPDRSGENVKFHWITYAGTLVKKHVNTPVMAVYDIRTHGRAEYILREFGCDFVCIGRQLLVDPEWPNKASDGREVEYCINCPRCGKFLDVYKCAVK